MITLYHAPQSRSSRMIWLLEELRQPYTIHPVSIFRPMTGEGAPDPANPHPDKRVPAINHGGTPTYVTAFPAGGTVPQASSATSVQPIICGATHWGAVQAGSKPSV